MCKSFVIPKIIIIPDYYRVIPNQTIKYVYDKETQFIDKEGNLRDWTQKDILAYMKQHNLPEPVRYSLKASSGVGFNLDCMLWMEKNYPQDLQRIYKTFPMAERVLWEYHNQQK